MPQSPIQVVGAKMALPTDKWVGIVQQAVLVSLAAGLTWAIPHITKEDLGQWAPAVVAAASLVLGYIQKVLANPVAPPEPIPVPVPVPVPPAPAPTPTPAPVPDHTDLEVDFPISKGWHRFPIDRGPR